MNQNFERLCKIQVRSSIPVVAILIISKKKMKKKMILFRKCVGHTHLFLIDEVLILILKYAIMRPIL